MKTLSNLCFVPQVTRLKSTHYNCYLKYSDKFDNIADFCLTNTFFFFIAEVELMALCMQDQCSSTKLVF